MKTFLYICTCFGGIIGTIILFFSLFAGSAPQQGAGAAVAVAFVVIPYCMARVTEKAQEKPLNEETLARLLIAQSQLMQRSQQSTPPAPPVSPAPPRNPFAPRP